MLELFCGPYEPTWHLGDTKIITCVLCGMELWFCGILYNYIEKIRYQIFSTCTLSTSISVIIHHLCLLLFPIPTSPTLSHYHLKLKRPRRRQPSSRRHSPSPQVERSFAFSPPLRPRPCPEPTGRGPCHGTRPERHRLQPRAPHHALCLPPLQGTRPE
jgi:hypothetical protein